MLEAKHNQVSHVKRLKEIFMNHHLFIDTSVTGSGKTYTTMLVAKHFGVPLLVVCPKSVVTYWKDVAKEFDQPVHLVITYNKIRQRKGCEILNSITAPDGSVFFSPTKLLQEWLENPMILVFDEVHKLKGKTLQNLACSVLARACYKHSKSRVAMLSGSPYDKPSHIVNLMKIMGFMTHEQLTFYNPGTKTLKLMGLQEIVDASAKINKQETETYLKTVKDFMGANAYDAVHHLFVKVFKPALVSSMDPPQLETIKDVKNGYYRLETDEQTKTLIVAIQRLKSASFYNDMSKSYDSTRADWGRITLALKAIEEAKLPILSRITKQILETDGYSKVVIFVNYIDSVKVLKQELEEYGVVCLQGSMNTNQRDESIASFQDPSSTTRVMISILTVGGTGINLHDTDGRYPRTTLVIPNFSISDLHQCTGRTYREGTKSNATIRFVYGQVGVMETNILNALTRKTDIYKSILDKQVSSGIKFPGEYESFFEPVDE